MTTFKVRILDISKLSRNTKGYRPVSILRNISKVCEKLMYNQLYSYCDNILSPNQFGFRKGHSAQQCLLVIIEKTL